MKKIEKKSTPILGDQPFKYKTAEEFPAEAAMDTGEWVDIAVKNVIEGKILADRGETDLWSFLKPSELGMSGAYTRRLINTICSAPGISYMEVGLAGGSTFVAATYKNLDLPNQYVGVDAWDPDHFRSGNHVKEKFFSTFEKYNGKLEGRKSKIEIFQGNYFTASWMDNFVDKNLNRVNFFFYDADHSSVATWWGIMKIYPLLSEKFIYLVDDWNDEHVRIGAWTVIKDMGCSVIRHYQFGSLAGDDLIDEEGKSKIPEVDPERDFGDYRTFYNGIGLFVLKKNRGCFFEMALSGDLKKGNTDIGVNYIDDPFIEHDKRLGTIMRFGDDELPKW